MSDTTPDATGARALELFHPETIAVTRAHSRRKPGTCSSDDPKLAVGCDCRADPVDLREVWAGRARMAAARAAAGKPLDAVDREAMAMEGL